MAPPKKGSGSKGPPAPRKRSPKAGAKARGKGASRPPSRRPRKRASKAKAKAAPRLPASARAALRRLLRWGFAATLGGVVGASFVVWVLYRQAVRDVEELLEGSLWSQSGRVLSAPLEVWPGLVSTAEELAGDLQAAGYARVAKARDPGDFEVSQDAILVLAEAGAWPGGTVEAGEILVTFGAGRVSSVSPKARAVFAPAELAGVRGGNDEERRPVALAQLPPHVPRAVLAMEDARFYEHEGLDPLGIARALVANAWSDGNMQGGSTLTQQLVKNLFLSQERTVERKAREAILAMALESRRSKDEILELYLNEIYLGQVGGVAASGIDQAARAYFGKPAERLSLPEAATLGGIVSAPNRYSPLRHPERAQERRDLTLDRMVALGWAEADEVHALKREALELHPTPGSRQAPWAVDAAVEAVESALGEGSVAARGVRIHTTIQPALQRLAERALGEGLAELERDHPKTTGAQGAVAVVRVKDGAILALVGSRDYAESQFDRASHASRQIGSTVKPLTALLAFEADPQLSPATAFADEPIERLVDGKTWAPRNYDGGYRGTVTLREALRVSRNVPAVLLSERVGLPTLRKGWQELGLSSATSNPSSALGAFGATPVELAGAFAVLPGKGQWSPPVLVRSATDADEVRVWEAETSRVRRTSTESAWLVTSMLQDVISSGTGKRAGSYGATGSLAGKTGTTDAYRDAWFVGYSPELVVAVWVGFDRDRELGLTGGQAALPTWARFMAWSGTTGGDFSRPRGLRWVDGCVACDATGGCIDSDGEWFRSGSSPEDCGGGGIFDLPGDGELWRVLQERIGERQEDRKKRREERKREREERRGEP